MLNRGLRKYVFEQGQALKALTEYFIEFVTQDQETKRVLNDLNRAVADALTVLNLSLTNIEDRLTRLEEREEQRAQAPQDSPA